LTGAVIVTTPQNVAGDIARKGLRMFQTVHVPVLGVVENMSYFQCPHCQEKTPIFSEGGGERVCRELGLPFLGAIPLDPEIVASGDEGVPLFVRNRDAAPSRAYLEIAKRLASSVSVVNYESSSVLMPKEMVERHESLSIEWADGHKSDYRFDYLRNNCPCAICVDEWTGKRKSLPLALPADFRPLGIEPVGNYAVQIPWSDGHNTGIYSYRRLRELCTCEECRGKA
jgi:ATP-binding protein involved in chromosome partitioning